MKHESPAGVFHASHLTLIFGSRLTRGKETGLGQFRAPPIVGDAEVLRAHMRFFADGQQLPKVPTHHRPPTPAPSQSAARSRRTNKPPPHPPPSRSASSASSPRIAGRPRP